MTRPVPVRRALGAVLTAGAVLAGVLATSGGPAQALPLPLPIPLPIPGASTTPAATPSGSAAPSTSASVTPSASASSSVSPGATPSTSASPSAAPCPIPVPGIPCIIPPASSPSATPTSSTGPSATPSGSTVAKPTVSVSPSTIIAVEQKAVVAGASEPGSTVELYAYSRPNTDYVKVRSTEADEDGRYSFEVGPSGNTRLYVRTVTQEGEADSDSIVLNVKTSLNLKVVRTGSLTYRFSGSLLPKRPGQLITVFYEKGGQRVIAGRARNAADGSYVLNRTFTSGGTFVFFTGTGTDNNNAANNSNRVRVALR